MTGEYRSHRDVDFVVSPFESTLFFILVDRGCFAPVLRAYSVLLAHLFLTYSLARSSACPPPGQRGAKTRYEGFQKAS